MGVSAYFTPVSKFVLKPARLLQTRLVPSKDEKAIELSFPELVTYFARADRGEGMKLCGLRQGMYVGLTNSAKMPGRKIIFVLYNENRTGNVDFVLKNDPSFSTRLLEAYRVEEASYDGVITEAPGAQEQVFG